MSTSNRIGITVIALVVVALGVSKPLRALEQPDCGALEKWAAGHATEEVITLAPEVSISALFADGRIEPLFGAPAARWSRGEFNQVRRWLSDCRRAQRKDKTAADRFYQAYQAVSKAMQPVYRMEQHRERSDRAVSNLVGYHRSDALVRVLELARDALNGTDVSAQVRALRVSSSVQGEVRVLQGAHGYLGAADIASLSARLEAGAAEVKAAMAGQNEAFEALQRQLAEIPLTMEGARTLARLSNDPLLSKIPRQQALDFQNAILQKRRAIHLAVRQREARQRAAAAAVPVDVTAVMERLVAGESVAEISLRGVKPGMPYLHAKKFMSTRFGFKVPTAGTLFKAFGPTGRDVQRYKQAERRDGGRFEFETMGERVGQVQYTEHFTGRMDPKDPQQWFAQRFGTANEVRMQGGALAMTWRDDGMNVAVSLGNRTTLPFRNPREYKSSMVITLWSDAYTGYRAEAERRCTQLRSRPASELSVQDRMDILKGCRD